MSGTQTSPAVGARWVRSSGSSLSTAQTRHIIGTNPLQTRKFCSLIHCVQAQLTHALPLSQHKYYTQRAVTRDWHSISRQPVAQK